jgi:lipoyl(octanoyl) transferase
MPVPQSLPQGISFCESERGGDLTYHGPGQLVVYPIVKLDGQGFGPHHDVAAFLRKVEKVFIDELMDLGIRLKSELRPSVREGATGVWIGERKIASLGVAIRKWVTYHGIALNCVNDLSPFHLISPCGFNPEVMTRLKDWIPLEENWRENLEKSLTRRFLMGVS